MARAKLLFVPRGYKVVLSMLYPSVPMLTRNGHALGAAMGNSIDLTDTHIGDEMWEFSRPYRKGGDHRGLLTVTVQDDKIEIEQQFPTGSVEMFEPVMKDVIQAFPLKPDRVAPTALYGVGIELEYTVDLGDDSKKLMSQYLRLTGASDDEADRLHVFGRPAYALGLRIGFPPYEEVDDDEAPAAAPEAAPDESGHEPGGADWHATVTLMSLPSDPNKMSVELGAKWFGPISWDDLYEALCERILTAQAFIDNKVKAFIDGFRP